MSKLTEYLALLPEGVKNIGAVVDGIRNNIKLEIGSLPQAEEEEIIRRRLICAGCPFMSANAVKAGVYTTKRTDDHCTHCGCPIATRTSALQAECGIATYNAKNPTTPMPLKWTAFKP